MKVQDKINVINVRRIIGHRDLAPGAIEFGQEGLAEMGAVTEPADKENMLCDNMRI